VAGPLRHLGELARSQVGRRATARADGEALGELEARPLELPTGLEVEWLGVSGYRLTCEGHTLFVDPYFSRVPFRDLLLRRRALPDQAALERFVRAPGKAVGVLVGHTHFDHAVDAPALARRLDCKAYGSASLVNLMALHGIAERAVEVEPYRVYELGPFEVSFTPSAHSKLLLGLAVPYDGELTCEHLDSLSPAAYRCGQVWGITIAVAGIRFYHQGSANLIDDAIRDAPVDVFLGGVAWRGFTKCYWRRVLTRLQPHTVVPTHYDDFFRPVDAEMGLTTNVNLAQVPEEIGAVSAEIELAALPRTDLGGPPAGSATMSS
jgi:L-ascorbate metabolism protein UlaG (beta-lactamase superfamily)